MNKQFTEVLKTRRHDIVDSAIEIIKENNSVMVYADGLLVYLYECMTTPLSFKQMGLKPLSNSELFIFVKTLEECLRKQSDDTFVFTSNDRKYNDILYSIKKEAKPKPPRTYASW